MILVKAGICANQCAHNFFSAELFVSSLIMFGIILAIIYLTKNRSVTFDLTNIQKYHFWMLLLLLAASPP